MKTTTVLNVAFALALSLLTADAHARGGSGGRSFSSGGSSMRTSQTSSMGSMSKSHQPSSLGNLGQGKKMIKTTSLESGAAKPDLNKGLSPNKSLATKDSFKGMNTKYPWKNGWGYGGYCWGGSWGWGGWGGCYDNWCCGDYYCYQPWCYSPCYDFCGEYNGPGFAATPVRRIARIVNPAETEATLSYSINGEECSLEAGQNREVELADNMTIEFDRGVGDATGRYSLTEGEYRFASTPKGWELYHSSETPAESVAAN